MEPQPATIDERQPSPPVEQDSEVTNDPPVHPYSNIPEARFAPAVSDKSTGPSTTSKGKEPSYRTVVPIQDPKIIDDVYKRAMKAPSVTVSHEELLSLSPDLRQRHRDQVTPKRVVTNSMEVVSTNFAGIMPFAQYELDIAEPDDKHLSATPPASSAAPQPQPIILQDPIEQYINNLRPGETEDPDILKVAKESHALRSIDLLIDNQEYIEAILDPGSQIIAMSEAVCHHLGLQYDPRIRLHMQSANGEVDESLGLARNVSAHIGNIVVYIQVHVIRSPAYDILLGRPFDVLTCSIVRNFPNEAQTITISDPNTGLVSTIPTKPRGRPRHYLSHSAMPVVPVNFAQSGNFRVASRI